MFGFIRNIDLILKYKIVPDSIYSLCLSIYQSMNNIVKSEEEHLFDADTAQVLDTIISCQDFSRINDDKTRFFKELISNASHALDEWRYKSLNYSDDEKQRKQELKIQIITDEINNTLTIRDNGIGMTFDHLQTELARYDSGCRTFYSAQDILEPKIRMGFLSAFLVSKKVMVRTKHDDDIQYLWQCDIENKSYYSIKSENNSLYQLEGGTEVILYLKKDSKEFAQRDVIKCLFEKECKFISFPVYLRC